MRTDILSRLSGALETSTFWWSPSAASAQIEGVAAAVKAAADATGTRGIGSLMSEVLGVELRMAAYLNAMREGFVAYMQGDSSGMRALVAASVE